MQELLDQLCSGSLFQNDDHVGGIGNIQDAFEEIDGIHGIHDLMHPTCDSLPDMRSGNPKTKRDYIVSKHRRKMALARAQVHLFLQQNGFDPGNVNSKKTSKLGLCCTFPLQSAVQQKNKRMVVLLLRFGADAWRRDTFGRSAYDMASEEVRSIFKKFAARTRLERNRPPAGFENFFAKIAKDPLANPRRSCA
ncbi:unnamed protein product [Effrenium voratum]|nr:unnamed protein product [Effrenium voratum]CAJ1452905.1 unnamed protein product [Effrenium voratum]